MRTLFIILSIAVLLAGGAAVYLAVTTPDQGDLVRFPLSDAHRSLVSRVPATAEAFAIVPSPAVLHATLLGNGVTRDAVLQWTAEHEMPRPWMLGKAPIVAWKSGDRTSYAVRLDSFRALLVRLWLFVSSNAEARWEGSTLIVNDPQPAAAPGDRATADLEELFRLGTGLPEGDALVVQRQGARGAFPPIGRPAVTSLRVTGREIVLVSRAAASESVSAAPVLGRFPRGAVLAASFATPPRILGDLNRLLGTRIDALVDDGGMIALYDVESGTLLPRPRGIISVPADDHARQQFREMAAVAEIVGETRDTGDTLLVSFDRTSMGMYLKDEMVAGAWPANRWILRIDPVRLVPILRSVGDSRGVRFAAPRIHRAARDLRRWIGALEQAQTIEAADSVTSGVEELRVRIAAK
jgi:hypothetical protein